MLYLNEYRMSRVSIDLMKGQKNREKLFFFLFECQKIIKLNNDLFGFGLENIS